MIRIILFIFSIQIISIINIISVERWYQNYSSLSITNNIIFKVMRFLRNTDLFIFIISDINFKCSDGLEGLLL